MLVAHSSACALVAHWAAAAPAAHVARVAGALLVAPSDPEGPHYPVGPSGFAPLPLLPLPFPSIVVASENDPYCALPRAEQFAKAFVNRFLLIVEPFDEVSDW